MQSQWIRSLCFVLLAGTCAAFAPAQEQQSPTAGSLIEQGRYAEEHEHDFAKAEELYGRAIALAQTAKDEALASQAEALRRRVKDRAAAIGAQAPAPGEEDAVICRIGNRLFDITHRSQGDGRFEEALRDLALFGAIAVPWIEKGIQGGYKLCDLQIPSEPAVLIRALARMSAPEGAEALERQLGSRDPLARRSVALYANPERHRALLLRALKDPAPAVRDQAIESLAASDDNGLSDTFSSFARAGNRDALQWISQRRPEEVLRIAAAPELPASTRLSAIEMLRESENFRPDAKSIDALLGLVRDPSDPVLRAKAVELLVLGLTQRWKPVAPELSRRIQSAILAAPDSFPQQYLVSLLSVVADASSLALIIDRTSPDDVNNITGVVMRILGASGPADFPSIVAAFAKAPGAVRANDQLTSIMRPWLENTAPVVSSAVLAKGANALPPGQRRVYLDRVVTFWLQANLSTEATMAKLPRFEPEFLELLREMASTPEGTQSGLPVRGLGASGDVKVLPDLMALVRSDDMPGEVATAIRRVTANDPQRVRTVLQLLLGNKTLGAESFAQAFRAIVDKPQPRETLAAAQAAWSPANADRLIALVTLNVPGPEGCQFLLAHYGELELAAFETRSRVIQRFGQELYEPALDVIGSALRDPSDKIRNMAAGVFERFKQARLQVSEFEKWRAGGDAKMIAELTALLQNMNPEIVLGAVKALTLLKARECTPKLIPLLERFKDVPEVKTAVMQAIEQLGQ